MIRKYHILIPTDFSANAENALNYALSFFAKHEIKLTFLHVYPVPGISPEMPAEIIYRSIDESKSIAREELSALCNKLKSNHPLMEFDYIIKQDPLHEACDEIVKKLNIDLIVMGTHGSTGLKKIFFGSNTARVINSSSCPVLAIPRNAKFLQMKTLLFATDYHIHDKEHICSLSRIASTFDSEIIVLHISEGKESDINFIHEFGEEVRKMSDYPKISFSLLGKSGIINSLDQFIETNEIDLMAMSTRKRSLFEKIFSPSLTQNMVYHTHIPLLAFHSNENFPENPYG